MITKQEMLDLLQKDIQPALGCTEPVCIALAAASATKAVGGAVKNIMLKVNPGLYKNAMSVAIPSFKNVGIPYAAAIGALIGNTDKGLRIFEDITEEIAYQAEMLVHNNAVQIEIDESKKKIYAECTVITENGTGTSIIKDSHTNIIKTMADNKIIFSKDSSDAESEDSTLERLLMMKISEIRKLVDSASLDELKFLLEGIYMNQSVADYGLNTPSDVGITKTLKNDIDTDIMGSGLMNNIMLKVSASIESRLDGCPLSVMSSAGAGSKGLALILPICETADYLGASNEMKAKAIAFGDLLNTSINAQIGKLSPMCTCAMAASTAASAAITWLFGGRDEQIGWAIRNMTGTITGMICDGGKAGCALKLSTASVSAFISARMALHDSVLRVSDGICAESPEECIRNIARLGSIGMADTDKEILSIMIGKANQNK